MQTFFTTFPWIIGILGLIVGSFLNVVILRFGKKTINGRSECMHCHQQLRWHELFPVMSYALQRGKCRTCKGNISAQYPLVELFTGILFYLSAVHLVRYFFDFSWSWVGMFISLLVLVLFLVLLFIYDVKHRLVPHIWLFGLLVSSIAYIVFWYSNLDILLPQSILFHGMGLLLALPCLVAWLLSKGKWFGFGDVLIIAWLGLFFGFWQGIVALLIAIYLGGLVGLGIIIWKRTKKIPYQEIRKIQVPFLPFLLTAWILVELLGVNLVAWLP